MRRLLCSPWRASWLLLVALCLHCAEASVHTEIQAGPLYRVAGSPLSISCNVSGFSSESAIKHFEFRVAKPAIPTLDINIISTSNPNFGYSSHQSRVRSKDISLTHVNPNSVLFEIKKLLKDDEGTYECFVTDLEGFNGVYNGKTTVKVIDDSLSVSLRDSITSLSYDEGEALTLTCQASSNTIQHTHLSLIWYLRKDGELNAQPIISLDRDFTLSPGQAFAQRYQDGLVILDKLGEATFRLKLAQLKLSDQGKIYCQAQEWIQDPDRSWYMIAQKDADEVTLTVKAREVLTDMSSLVVNIVVQHAALQEGQELLLSCNIDSQNLEERFFSVSWFWNDIEMASIGPTGILNVGSEYSEREKKGDLRATRSGNKEYRLSLKPVRTQDQGQYKCRAWPQDRGQNGAFTPGASQDSSTQPVTITATETGLSVQMQHITETVAEGDKLRLSCRVDGVKGQLSVTWKHAANPSVTFTTIISLSQYGVMEKAETFKSRQVTAMRPETNSFIFELDNIKPSDSGVYQCDVSEWKTNGESHTQSKTTSVNVASVESLVTVSLSSRNARVTVGDKVELMCRVKGPNMPISLTWVQNGNNIVTLKSGGAISWSGDQQQYQVKVNNQNDASVYYLQISRASSSEDGLYQCSASVFLDNAYRKPFSSNQLTVTVQKPESKLQLSASPTMTQNINTDIQISCSVTSASSELSFFAVTWMVNQGAGNNTIISIDRDAFVSYGPETELRYGQRTSVRQKKQQEWPSFELTIRQAKTSDSGLYVCWVVEWMKDPHGIWFSLPEKSIITELTVAEPANDFLLDKMELEITAREGDGIQFRCNISSGATDSSFSYKVTWLYTPHSSSIINASLVELDHTGLLSYPQNQALSGLQGRLRLSRPSQSSFYLRIQGVHEGDGGTFWCQVEQYQLDNDRRWQQKASDSAGPIKLTISVAANDFLLDKMELEITAREGDGIQFRCNISSGATDSSFSYKVTWLYTPHSSSIINASLVELDHTGLLSYPQNQALSGLQGRLRLSRPSQSSFYLRIQGVHEGDGGTFWCQVEQYQLDNDRRWQQKASDSAGPIKLTISVADKQLFIEKKDVELNVSIAEEFSIPCCITRQSSNESKFQVTWFWQRSIESKPQPIFTAYRNSTLQFNLGKAILRFGHPSPSQFNLTVSKPGPENSGLYFCKVEEWLPSLSHGWRRIAEGKSGNLTVTVSTEGVGGSVSDSGCSSSTLILILIVVVSVSFLVILFLVVKVVKSKASAGKKPNPSLWAEQHALTKPGTDD